LTPWKSEAASYGDVSPTDTLFVHRARLVAGSHQLWGLYDVHEGDRKRDFNAKKFDALLIRFALGL
jgi:hypothetical protein